MTNHTTAKTREALIHDVDNLKRTVARVAQDVREHATAHVDEARDQVAETVQSFRNNLVSHPFSLLGIGFAVGLLMGLRLRSQ